MNQKVKSMRDAFLSTIEIKAEMLSDSDQCVFYGTCLSFLDAMLFDRGVTTELKAKVEAELKVEKPAAKAPKKASKKAAPAKAPEPVVEEPEVIEVKPEVVEPEPEVVEAVEEAAKAAVPTEVPAPKDDETEEETFARRAAFCAVYGSKTLGEVFEDETVSGLLAPEFGRISEYGDLMYERCKDVYDGFDRDAASEAVNAQIASVDDSVETFTDLTVDKFLNVFYPYMAQMYFIFDNFTPDQVKTVMKDMSNGVLTDGYADLDYTNAEAVAAVLDETYPAQE